MRTLISRSIGLLVAVALLLSSPGFADSFHFRVAFESVSGVEAIEAGDLQAGIKVLEDQLAQIESANGSDVLATLCAAYVINRSLDKAKRVCDEAIKIDPSETAYNNRGVYRAFTGDFLGAREDFERARPPQLQDYLDQLWATDVPLMAENNFHLVDELLATRSSPKTKSSFAIRIAEIEIIGD